MRADDTHRLVAVDPLLDCRAPDSYPPERTARRIFRVLSPEAEAWAVAAAVPRPPSESCPILDRPESSIEDGRRKISDSDPVPAITTPIAGSVFAISAGVPRERQRIELRALAGANVVDLTILVDDVPIAMLNQPPYRAIWQLIPGKHHARVEVRDASGHVWRSAEIEFIAQE
jgi:hypothetical protein